MISHLKIWASGLKVDIVALWLAARDPRVPWTIKAVAASVVAYALSPIDLIPDFIPVLGYLDDLLIVPAGIWLVVRLIPAPLMVEFRARAALLSALPKSPIGLIIVIFLWAIMTIGLALLAWRLLFARSA